MSWDDLIATIKKDYAEMSPTVRLRKLKKVSDSGRDRKVMSFLRRHFPAEYRLTYQAGERGEPND